MTEYPKRVRVCDVAGNGNFSPGLYKIEGGRSLYDECVIIGGNAAYLVRLENRLPLNGDGKRLHAVRRWIDWDTPLIQMMALEETP